MQGGGLLNSKSELTRGGKIPSLVIMVEDKEVHSNCSERRRVKPDTFEYSPEIVPVIVGRNSMIIPAGKMMVQPLISDVAKKMKISLNIAKRKREDKEPQVHCEDDNSRNYVVWNKYGNEEVATFDLLPDSK